MNNIPPNTLLQHPVLFCIIATIWQKKEKKKKKKDQVLQEIVDIQLP